VCAPQSGKLGTVLRSLGFTPTEADVEEMQGKAGATVNFDALLGFISAAKAKTIKEPDVVEALKVFDKDGNGFIKTVRARSSVGLWATAFATVADSRAPVSPCSG
jgi:Ca2+-binding EF-hand superfamily protein